MNKEYRKELENSIINITKDKSLNLGTLINYIEEFIDSKYISKIDASSSLKYALELGIKSK